MLYSQIYFLKPDPIPSFACFFSQAHRLVDSQIFRRIFSPPVVLKVILCAIITDKKQMLIACYTAVIQCDNY